MSDPESAAAERERMLGNWEQASRGWGRRADDVRSYGMPVSERMVELLGPQPGPTILELAAGPGDTGFLAAPVLEPGGRLITSDAAAGMLELARERAAAQGIDNVEFKQLQLEWIDLEAASVDGILCRWGVMLVVDPDAALRECRRVLRPGGRISLGVWDLPDANPWATITQGALRDLGHVPPPDPSGPGMFAMAAPGRLAGRLIGAGFFDPAVEPVEITRRYDSVDDFLDETGDCSMLFATAWRGLDGDQRAELVAEVTRRAEPYTDAAGALTLPGRSLVAVAEA